MPRETRPRKPKNCACPSKAKPQARLTPVLAITTDGEAERLWRHAIIGSRTCVALLNQYAEVGMTKMPVAEIAALRDALSKIVKDHVPSAES